MKKRNIFIICLVFIFLITSCSNEELEKEYNSATTKENLTKEEKKEEIDEIDRLFEELDSEIEESENTLNNTSLYTPAKIEKKLIVDERCIWCGKCAFVAPNHFAMDRETFTAVVTNQKDIMDEEVSTAIDICPTDSIKLS